MQRLEPECTGSTAAPPAPTRVATAPPAKVFYGWPMLAALCAVNFIAFGFTMFVAAVAIPYMINDYGWSRAAAGAVISILFVVMGFASLPAAYLVRRIGARPTMLIGAALVGAGALIAFFAQTLTMFYIGIGFVMGTGKSMLALIPIPQIVANWFSARRGIALGILMTTGGVAALTVAPMAAAIAQATGEWRLMWALPFAGSILAVLLIVTLIRERPEEMGLSPDGVSDEAPKTGARTSHVHKAPRDWAVGAALRSPVFWAINIAAAIAVFAVAIVNSQSILHLQDMGADAVTAASILGVTGLSGIFGRLLAGALADRIEPRHLITVGLALESVSLVVLSFAHTHAAMLAFALLFGLGLGLALVSVAAILVNYFGPGVYSSLVAGQALTATLIAGCGPILAGHIRDLAGTYQPVFLGYAIVALPAAALLVFLRPPQDRRSVEAPVPRPA